MLGTDDNSGGIDLVTDGAERTFMEDVIEGSKDMPIIVDFWAPWCGPCKTLGPALEAAVKAAGGKVRMVKINIDENQQLAQQMRIQSIPAVYAFSDGKPVDGFVGNQTPAQVKEFVKKMADLAGGDGLEDALAAAEEMLAEGAAVDAAETFAAILGEDGSNAQAYAGLVRSHLALDQADKAGELLANVPEDIAEAAEIIAIRAQIELAEAAADAGPVGELRETVSGNPDDHQARYELATALAATGDNEAAIAELLELFRRDREWNDGAAKLQLFKIFDSLPGKDPIVLTGRRKLSSMIFA
ncbi:MAG: thioredoxin [Alphaproteobacteria bacterium]|nr:thioredoxin [Alphaproteobacteria bacterium]